MRVALGGVTQPQRVELGQIMDNSDLLSLVNLWDLWSLGKLKDDVTLFGHPLFWWDRYAKVLGFFAGTVILIDIFGEKRLHHAGERLAALLSRIRTWYAAHLRFVVVVCGAIVATLALTWGYSALGEPAAKATVFEIVLDVLAVLMFFVFVVALWINAAAIYLYLIGRVISMPFFGTLFRVSALLALIVSFIIDMAAS